MVSDRETYFILHRACEGVYKMLSRKRDKFKAKSLHLVLDKALGYFILGKGLFRSPASSSAPGVSLYCFHSFSFQWSITNVGRKLLPRLSLVTKSSFYVVLTDNLRWRQTISSRESQITDFQGDVILEGQSKCVSITISVVGVSPHFPRTWAIGVKVFKHTETKVQPDTSRCTDTQNSRGELRIFPLK